MTEIAPEARLAAPTPKDLAEEHGASLYRLAYGLAGNEADAWDLTQETFLAAIQGLHRLVGAASERAWLLSILHHKFVDRLRRRRPAAAAEPPTVAPEDPLEQAETNARVRRAIALLPEDLREALLLYYVEDFGVSEIARVQDVPPGTVKSRLFHAREKLKEMLA